MNSASVQRPEMCQVAVTLTTFDKQSNGRRIVVLTTAGITVSGAQIIQLQKLKKAEESADFYNEGKHFVIRVIN